MTIETQNGNLINYDHSRDIVKDIDVDGNIVVKVLYPNTKDYSIITCCETEDEADSCIYDIKQAIIGGQRLISFKV